MYDCRGPSPAGCKFKLRGEERANRTEHLLARAVSYLPALMGSFVGTALLTTVLMQVLGSAPICGRQLPLW